MKIKNKRLEYNDGLESFAMSGEFVMSTENGMKTETFDRSVKRHSQEKIFLGYLIFSVCFFFLLNVLLCWINLVPPDDVAARYAPMAEAFRDGNWEYAFHPRFGLLFPTTAGSIAWITGCSGFRSCQIAAVLFFALAAFPLYAIFKNLFGLRVALLGTFLYLICSHLLRLAFEGLRDDAKTLGTALAVYGLLIVLRHVNRKAAWISLSAGTAMLTILRGDGAFFALTLFAIACTIEWYNTRKIPFRTITSFALFLLFITPQLIYTAQAVGYPVPECRHAKILKDMGIKPVCRPQMELP